MESTIRTLVSSCLSADRWLILQSPVLLSIFGCTVICVRRYWCPSKLCGRAMHRSRPGDSKRWHLELALEAV